MIKIRILIISFFHTFLFSQTNNRCKNIQINTFNISINGKQFPVQIENWDMVNKMYNDIRIDKNCFEDYLEIKCIMQNGNEYRIEYLIYQLDNGFYKQKFQYSLYSNREGHQFYGNKGDNSVLSKIKIAEGVGNILINESYNLQDVGSEVYKSYYPQLITKYKTNFEILNLLGNSYIIKNEEIFYKEKIDIINDLAYYLYFNKSYNSSIYLLNQILQKSPTRTVAYLNLADSYWAIGNQELAKENYKKYVELMKSQNKDLKKIPRYVWERSQ